MSEQLQEPYPFEKIKTSSGKERELTRDNTSVYTHLGRQALYDHVLVEAKENPVYLWRYSVVTGKEVSLYHRIKDSALENDCQAFMNMRVVDPSTVNIYVKHATTDLKTIPPEFDIEDDDEEEEENED